MLLGGRGQWEERPVEGLGSVLGDFAQMNCPKAHLFDHADASRGGRYGGSRSGSNFGLRQDVLARTANDLEARCLAVCEDVGGEMCLNDENSKQITGGGDTMAV